MPEQSAASVAGVDQDAGLGVVMVGSIVVLPDLGASGMEAGALAGE
jgi:hypothetical protein